MDLPKNITQIGTADPKCKVYVEDYVVSFLKQLNPLARDKTMAAALYGRRSTQEEKEYLFVYGAGKLDFLQKETKHLSQAQKQEVERIRRQYFRDYEFLGYRILDGEMVDGFYICQQEECRFVSGYAQFYEKNDAMLVYMLEARQGDASPESVDSQRYDMVKERQEARRAKYTEAKKGGRKRGGMIPGQDGAEDDTEEVLEDTSRKLPRVRGAAVVTFCALCALGIALNASFRENGSFSLQKYLGGEQPSGEQEVAASGILEAEDELTKAVAAENHPTFTPGPYTDEGLANVMEQLHGMIGSEEGGEGDREETTESLESGTGTENPESGQAEGSQNSAGVSLEETESVEEESREAVEETPSPSPEPKIYTVCKGDTLIGISQRIYGSEKYVQEICRLNNLEDPDNIKIGQKILLP